MMYKLIFLGLVFIAVQSEKLVRVQVNDQVRLKIPESFSPMTLEDQQQRVQSYRKPLALYTSPDRYVELGVNITYSKFRGSDIEIMKDFYKASLANLFTDVEFHSEEIREINGKPFVIFSFTSLVTDVDNALGDGLNPVSKYTYIAYTVVNGDTYLIHLTCPVRQRPRWETVAQSVIETVEIKS